MCRAACVCVFPHPHTSRPSLAPPIPILRRALVHALNRFPVCPRACALFRPCGDRPLIVLPFSRSPHPSHPSLNPTHPTVFPLRLPFPAVIVISAAPLTLNVTLERTTPQQETLTGSISSPDPRRRRQTAAAQASPFPRPSPRSTAHGSASARPAWAANGSGRIAC